MITRQHRAVGIGWRTSPALDGRTMDRRADTDEPAWVWETLRSRFWEPADLIRSMRSAGGLGPEQREVAAWWWSLLAAAGQLGPRMYAAAFLRASEQHDSDELRWSLLAILRDEVQHEQLFRLGMRSLAPECPRRAEPRAPFGQAEQHLREANQQAERCWYAYRQALDRHGIAVATGGLLLAALVTASLYDRCALGCAIPAFATAFRHLGHDAKRHQGALRALAARNWPRLSAPQRAETAALVHNLAGFLTVVLLGPAEPPGVVATGGPANSPTIACREGLGVPSRDERLEILRAALLKVKDLHLQYGLPFPAMPQLSIPGSQPAITDDQERGGRHAGR